MAQITTAPAFRAFNLALIQLGGITANKTENLRHAREMILKAANGDPKPNLIVLPVRKVCLIDNCFIIQRLFRNASIHPMVMCISLSMLSQSDTHRVSHTKHPRATVRA